MSTEIEELEAQLADFAIREADANRRGDAGQAQVWGEEALALRMHLRVLRGEVDRTSEPVAAIPEPPSQITARDRSAWGLPRKARSRDWTAYGRPGRLPRVVGDVYVIEAENGLRKIGYSVALQTRVATLAWESPIALRLSMTLRSDHATVLETLLHDRFDSKRSHGEWFALDDADLRTMTEAGNDPELTGRVGPIAVTVLPVSAFTVSRPARRRGRGAAVR